MGHDKHVIDGSHMDVPDYDFANARERFLALAEGHVSPYPDPVVVRHDCVDVVRDDLIVGTKCRGGALFMERCENDTIVYVQPRVGLAGVSILECAKKYGKKVVLFMPSSKRISHHQACTIERGATPIFKRIAAMPNLNLAAKRWAEAHGAAFVPLGLKHHLVMAGIIQAAVKVPPPVTAFVATSTGVLTRSLQIAWPETEFISVCVARNMKLGELGRASFISEPAEFGTPEKNFKAPFPSVPTYDEKVWKYALAEARSRLSGNPHSEGVLMWNVGKEPVLDDETLPDRIDSYRDWEKPSLNSGNLKALGV